MRRSDVPSGGLRGFRPPTAVSKNDVAARAPSSSPTSFQSPKSQAQSCSPVAPRGSREVFYPPPSGRTQDEIVQARLAKRTDIAYFQPKSSEGKERYDEEGRLVQSIGFLERKRELEHAEAEISERADATGAAPPNVHNPLGAQADNDDKVVFEEEELEEVKRDVIGRYPVSPLGKLYFQVETDGATRHESVGIIIIDVEERAVQMFDRVGRQHGNRPDPGYPLKAEEIDAAAAGVTLRIGAKPVLIVTALKEDAFRSGEFFLRSEHDQRKKEQAKKAKEEAVVAAETLQKKPKMSFGASLAPKLGGGNFAALEFRKRPREGQSGFTVPLAGRPKAGKSGFEDLKALHDHDRENAVVLFRADYKRDAEGQPIVSVVVDPVIGDKLRPHQRIGVKFLYDCVTGERMPGYYGCILADEMGLGKTIQTVATVYTCLKQGKRGVPISRKCLVVAPSSLVRNWCNEFDKWIGEGVVKAFAISESTPKGDRILSRFESEGDVLVISYDQLRKYVDRISKITAVDLVVCDEGHRLKNAEIKTTKAVDLLPTKRRIILSGTPIQNDLTEFHAMVGFVNPGILGNRDLFARVFEEPIMQGRDPQCPETVKYLGVDRAHYLANLTQKFILRRTQTINEKYLPAKVDCTVFCRLGEEQRKAYQKISDLAGNLSSAPLVLITALKKLCNHMDLLADAVAGRASSSTGPALPSSVLPKGYKMGSLNTTYGSKLAFVSAMLDQLQTNGERDKLVIVSNYTQTLDIIAALCTTKRVSFFQLDGSTPIKKRQELVDRFNVPMAQEIVFLLSSKAGGVGLNLIGANRLILFDPDWNPANDAQAMGRVWRDGQKKKVFLYRLLCTGSIEEKVYQRQVSKQGLSANVVDMQDDSKQHFTSDELKALFVYRPDTSCDTHDLLGCKCLMDKTSTEVGKGGFRKIAQKSGPRMDELKSWKHIADVRTFTLDKVMQKIAKDDPAMISFLFANERDAKKLDAAECVEPERPFKEDEGSTISCSQAAARKDIPLVVSKESIPSKVTPPPKPPQPKKGKKVAESSSESEEANDEGGVGEDMSPRARRLAARLAAKEAVEDPPLPGKPSSKGKKESAPTATKKAQVASSAKGKKRDDSPEIPASQRYVDDEDEIELDVVPDDESVSEGASSEESSPLLSGGDSLDDDEESPAVIELSSSSDDGDAPMRSTKGVKGKARKESNHSNDGEGNSKNSETTKKKKKSKNQEERSKKHRAEKPAAPKSIPVAQTTSAVAENEDDDLLLAQ